MEEEIVEWREALAEENQIEKEKEFGDILFAMINLARYYKINPEIALMRTNNKFMNRFQFVEKEVANSGKDWTDFTLAELDIFWEKAKQKE